MAEVLVRVAVPIPVDPLPENRRLGGGRSFPVEGRCYLRPFLWCLFFLLRTSRSFTLNMFILLR